MTGLDALRGLGWKARSLPALGVTDPGKTIIRKDRHSVEIAGDDDLAAGMALAAALVAEGHDLIGLLRQARAAIRVSIPPPGCEDAHLDLIRWIDAVLAAVDGAT